MGFNGQTEWDNQKQARLYGIHWAAPIFLSLFDFTRNRIMIIGIKFLLLILFYIWSMFICK